ncbi:MAG: MarR family transcriptional regulator [Firmicutes bacterium HGW-Firmicutes-8]|nr:MAG: MarR family transcriptional regulator [Firmicutes bacterium HGW-Firmicutes-8]
MEKSRNPIAQKLLESFTQFHRLNWRQSPIVGLKSSEIMLLFCIKRTVKSDSVGIKVSDISSALKVASPTVTQLINGLETSGFVERTMDQEDRRAVRVNLTDKGKRTLEKVSDVFYNSFDGLVEYLGEEESSKLAELLSKVFTYFNETRKENF